MKIPNSILDLIVKKIKVEFSGCHAPHRETPLYGRCAYWRIYLPDGTYVAKVTTPVKSLNPKEATLQRLLKAELKKRIEEIGEVVEFDHYGRMDVVKRDPYGIRRILEVIEGEYYSEEV